MNADGRSGWEPRRQVVFVLASMALSVLLMLVQACGTPTNPGPFGSTIDLTTDCSGVRTSADPCDSSTTRLEPADLPELPCPTPAEIELVRQEVPVWINNDVSRGVLVCREQDGSADLTAVENNVYQSLLFLRRMRFDRPVPWTAGTVYDWVRRTIPAGIVVESSGNSYSCLGCSGPIHVAYSSQSLLGPTVDRLIVTLIVHEARHADGWPHTCGRDTSYFNAFVRDRSVAEMGGFGVQYLLAYWLGHYSDEAPAVRDYYRKYAAQLLGRGSFCCECGVQRRAAQVLWPFPPLFGGQVPDAVSCRRE